MLTDEIQVAYSQTEGYCPVTAEALNSEEFQAYLAQLYGRETEESPFEAGEREWCQTSAEVTRLLVENVDHMFSLPVFPGSSRPKAAAGELVERAAKAARRKQELDPEKLFDQVIADFVLEEKPAEKKGAPAKP